MPMICYQSKDFTAEHEKIIVQANAICDDYTKQGYTLTLRQLYYQFVARALIPNTMKDYKRLGGIINDARLAGLIDWDAIEDRTRNLEELSTWGTPKDLLAAVAKQFRYDYWDSQPGRVEIWVEKEALVGVVERIAHRYRVPYFACRGYTSQSEAWRAGQRFNGYAECGQPIKVIHLGDHDPSGIDMTRDNRDRLNMFGENAEIEVIRVALNEDQVQRYRPPPNPAKLTDSRAQGYVERFGYDSWELDALEPNVIDEIVSAEIETGIDWDAWTDVQEREKAARKRMEKLAKDWKEPK